ncbi:MAG: cysteine-rich small domain-containing protein [Oscillospiraceae bacterium]
MSDNRENADTGRSYSYFSNTDCEYFPCHATEDKSNFNCLFCFCPLYHLGDKCGGNFALLPDGRKDCSSCLLPHKRENYGRIIKKLC